MKLKTDFETIEKGIEKLKEAVKLRDSMGGVLYYNIIEDNCCDMANKLCDLGADKEEINTIMGR